MKLSSTAKLNLFYLALAVSVGAAIFLSINDPAAERRVAPRGFVTTAGTRFVADGAPFRFAGANVAVMYRDEDRALMPQTMRHAAEMNLKVVRVWANGEGGAEDGITSVGADRADWPRTHRFRFAPDKWNEEAFVQLDRVLAEAARDHLRVQLTLANWWRDTGGVTQYLRWAGIKDAADAAAPYGVNNERAMAFYTNETTKRLYREHVEKIIARRNTITGIVYRDDPTIFSYELMNEAQAPTGRWAERRAWMAEMSAFVKSLDANHLVTSGSWGYRSAVERRAWIEEQKLPTLDYCDVHNYPRDDRDSFVTSTQSLTEFIENRAAAAFSINKPLVVGEFGMTQDGYEGASQAEWFDALYDASRRAGASGAIFWILTPDPRRGYGVTYTTTRDDELRAEIARDALTLAARTDTPPPIDLLKAGRHLVPRQFAFARAPGDAEMIPKIEFVKDAAQTNANANAPDANAQRSDNNAHATKEGEGINATKDAGGANDSHAAGAKNDARESSDKRSRSATNGRERSKSEQNNATANKQSNATATNEQSSASTANNAANKKESGGATGAIVYRFKPEAAARGRFEKIGGGDGFVWGAGVGFFEYVTPARTDWRRVSEIVVRAHVQPVLPADAHGRLAATRVTLFINDTDCGSRVVALEQPPAAIIQEWRVASLLPRLAASRGKPLSIRFVVSVEADLPFGVNISNFPEGFDARERKPVEVEIR